MAEQTPARPKRVVIVDADNPLVEVEGEFFWREDHERIVAAAREEAYAAGWADATRAVQPQELVVRYRRPTAVRFWRAVVVAAVVVGMISLLLASFLTR